MALVLNSKKNIRKNVYINHELPKKKKAIKLFVFKQKLINFLAKINVNLKFNSINITKIVLSVVLALSIFSLLTYLVYRTYTYATNSEYFNIRHIEFTNNKHLSDEELLKISGLEFDKNILTYNIDEIKFKLLRNPWVDKVTITRDLPNKFFIDIVEKKPVFWAVRDNELYYIDKNFNFIAPITEEKFISLPTLHIKIEDEYAMSNLANFIDELNNAGLPFTINDVSWLSINPMMNYEFYIENFNINFSVGIEDFKNGVQNLALVMSDLEKRNEVGLVKSIKVAFNQVTIEKN